VEVDQHPPIVHVQWHGVSGGRHAVVVCGVHGDSVDIVNPAGTAPDGVEQLPKGEFLRRWDALGFDSIYFTE
jgi:hypothetical protein